MGGFEMVDRVLQALEYGFVRFDVFAGTFEQSANIRFEVTEPFAPSFVRDFGMLKLIVKFFEKFAQVILFFLIVQGKALLSIRMGQHNLHLYFTSFEQPAD